MKKHIIFFASISPFILIGALLATYFRGQQFTAGDMLEVRPVKAPNLATWLITLLFYCEKWFLVIPAAISFKIDVLPAFGGEGIKAL